MAKKIVPPDQANPKIELANDTHWFELDWSNNPLPEHLKAHLLQVNRCIVGSASLALLLHRFEMGMEDVEATGDGDDFRVVYPHVDKNEMDRLRVGLQQLLDMAEATIKEVRDYRGGFTPSMLVEKARG